MIKIGRGKFFCDAVTLRRHVALKLKPVAAAHSRRVAAGDRRVPARAPRGSAELPDLGGLLQRRPDHWNKERGAHVTEGEHTVAPKEL